MSLFKRRQPSNCPTCHAGVDAEQMSCVECGTLLARRSTLASVAWRLPVATVGAVVLVMAMGIGYASGAVVQDGDVSVAEAPAPDAQTALPEASGSDQDGDGDGDGGGSDDLAKLDPPHDGDGNGNGDSKLDDGDDDHGDDDHGDDDGGDDNGNGNGNGGGGNGDSDGGRGNGGGSDRSDRPAPEQPEFSGPEESRDLAKFPSGGTGYTVALKVSSRRGVAVREANAAVSEAEGIPAGVIDRSDFPSLPGAYVAFAGRFNTRAEADRAQENYTALGFSGEVIFVGSAEG